MNLDNIAKNLEAATEKSTGQAEQETAVRTAEQQQSVVDKVSAVADTAVVEEAGLTGAARTTAPVAAVLPVERDQKFGPVLTSAIATINEYELKMGRGNRNTTDQLDGYQSRLYNAIKSIVSVDENSEFMGGMEYLFRKFREDTYGAFAGDMVRRRINFMSRPSGEKAFMSYNAFLDLLDVFSVPEGRKVFWSRFNKRLSLDFVADVTKSAEKRQRLEMYMAKICS